MEALDGLVRITGRTSVDEQSVLKRLVIVSVGSVIIMSIIFVGVLCVYINLGLCSCCCCLYINAIERLCGWWMGIKTELETIFYVLVGVCGWMSCWGVVLTVIKKRNIIILGVLIFSLFNFKLRFDLFEKELRCVVDG